MIPHLHAATANPAILRRLEGGVPVIPHLHAATANPAILRRLELPAASKEVSP